MQFARQPARASCKAISLGPVLIPYERKSQRIIVCNPRHPRRLWPILCKVHTDAPAKSVRGAKYSAHRPIFQKFTATEPARQLWIKMDRS